DALQVSFGDSSRHSGSGKFLLSLTRSGFDCRLLRQKVLCELRQLVAAPMDALHEHRATFGRERRVGLPPAVDAVGTVGHEGQHFAVEIVGVAGGLRLSRPPMPWTPHYPHLPLQLGELRLLALAPGALMVGIGPHGRSPYVRTSLRKGCGSGRKLFLFGGRGMRD